MNEFERRVEFIPAYDRIAEGYGRHCVDMQMHLVGEAGAISFTVFTGWNLPHFGETSDPMGVAISYHSRVQRKDWERPMPCDVLGGQCYGGSHYTIAEEVFDTLVKEGGEAVWRRLEEFYREVFDGNVPEGEE